MKASTTARGEARKDILIIGAGPAGLTAAYTLLRKRARAVSVTIVEADSQYVGGLARTIRHRGFHFDIGGHRFFSKSREINDLWNELLPDDMLERPRASRIYYRGRFFSYPLKAGEAFFKLGPIESLLCLASYFKARILPVSAPKSFEDWVSNRFGRRLFRIFFKTYTEKVWGMSCSKISADWAAQRIMGLSLSTAIKNALRSSNSDQEPTAKTLINSFRYPRRGPGMMWEACAEKVKRMGGHIVMGHRVVECAWDEEGERWTVTASDREGSRRKFEADEVISSAPLRSLARTISPKLSPDASSAACALRYRDFLLVALIVKDRSRFADNWIYIHDPTVRVGRIQNFKSWSPDMVPDPSLACYGMEYFCFENDDLWAADDATVVDVAVSELEQIGLGAKSEVVDAFVVRQPKAYPVYDDRYAANVETLRAELEQRFPTLHVAGRNGMHKYNNQDHAMMTGILCAENVLAGKRLYDPWRVNQDAEYLEDGAEIGNEGQRLVPRAIGRQR